MDSCAWVPNEKEENDILYVVFSEGDLNTAALSINHEFFLFFFLLCVDTCTNVYVMRLRFVNYNFARLFI